MIKFKENIELIQEVKMYDVILIGMGINNTMDDWFPEEIRINFPQVYDFEKTTNYGDRRKYGDIKYIKHENIIFCLCYFHEGGYNNTKKEFVLYDKLENCLNKVRSHFKNKKIGTTLLGTSVYDGKGDREKILEIFNRTLNECNVTIYEYESEERKLKFFKKIAELHRMFKEHTITSSEYIVKRREIEWERLHGIYNKMPENFDYQPKKYQKKSKLRIVQGKIIYENFKRK